jgi:3'-phosphoadenosine 5'-phosphosulfate sulfotransferase (PAPS reductase)/FAD synthetase
MNKENIICWFSCGITSAVATKIALEQYSQDYNVLIYYFKIDSAHPDNNRFIEDCERWYNQKIIQVQGKYKDQFDVIRQTKYVNGEKGARCTLELKKELRYKIEKEIEFKHQVFGFEFSPHEVNRAIRFIEQNPNTKCVFPLIEKRLNKKNCFKYLLNENIEIPTMYKLGYKNNNCIACVKGGQGYFNKIRIDFPEYFNNMIEAEAIAGHSCIKKDSEPLFLKDLEPNKGHKQKIDLPDCSSICEVEFADIISPKLNDIMKEYKSIKELYLY